MDRETQRARAIRFRDLHQGPGILVLVNAWDAASACIFEKAGCTAIATSSAGVAASLGFADEDIPVSVMLEAVARIASAVSLPVSADMEAGFGDTAAKVVETAKAVLQAGGIGMNLEDAAGDPALHVEKVQAVRHASDAAGIKLVINARTDVYLRQLGDPAGRFDEAVRRANAYRKAGADCLFVPGVRDAATIGRLTAAIDGPVNILAVPGVPPVPELQRLGVRRVSVGSGAMRATLALAARIARELLDVGTYTSFSDATPSAEVQRLFKEQK
jgi:2-methylisocitrate lyase-like PEP mutase family enzyme